MANVHGLQYGRAAPVPKKDAPKLRVNRQQLEHFLSFISSPHLVQDLPSLRRINGASKAATGSLGSVALLTFYAFTFIFLTRGPIQNGSKMFATSAFGVIFDGDCIF